MRRTFYSLEGIDIRGGMEGRERLRLKESQSHLNRYATIHLIPQS